MRVKRTSGEGEAGGTLHSTAKRPLSELGLRTRGEGEAGGQFDLTAKCPLSV